MKVLVIFSVVLAMAYAAPKVLVYGDIEINEERTFERIDAIVAKAEKFANDELERAEKKGNQIIERALSVYPHNDITEDRAELEEIVLQATANVQKEVGNAKAAMGQLVENAEKEWGNGNRYTAATISAARHKINNIIADGEKDIYGIVLQTGGALMNLYNGTVHQLESMDENYIRHGNRQQTVNKMDKLIQNAESKANIDIQNGETAINKVIANEERAARDAIAKVSIATGR